MVVSSGIMAALNLRLPFQSQSETVQLQVQPEMGRSSHAPGRAIFGAVAGILGTGILLSTLGGQGSGVQASFKASVRGPTTSTITDMMAPITSDCGMMRSPSIKWP